MFSSFTLKIIAIIFMLCDHFGDAILKPFSFFNVLGRIAFPIFAFQLTEGYIHTKNLKKYFKRLIIFAIISQIPFMLFSSTFTSRFSLNIFFTLFIGLFAIYIYDKSHNKFLGILVTIFLCALAQLIKTDYGAWGVCIIMIFYIFKDKKIGMCLLYLLSCLLKYLPYLLAYNFHYIYMLLLLGTASSIFFIILYNGKQGKKVKYLLYAFYPLHMLALYFINVAIS